MLCVFCPPFKVYTSVHASAKEAIWTSETIWSNKSLTNTLPSYHLRSCIQIVCQTHRQPTILRDHKHGPILLQASLLNKHCEKCCEIDINPFISVEFVEAPLPQSRFRHDTSRPNPWAKSDRWSIGQSFIMQEIFFVEISMGDRQNIVERVMFNILICW